MLSDDLDAELIAERTHLSESRAALARMRNRAEEIFSTGQDIAGDAYTAEQLGRTLARRVAELADDPTTALFFGRLDVADGEFHVGRRHVTDDLGEPMVLDWRAPLSRSFYRASVRDPQGVAVRRRFGFVRGELTSFEDEHLDRGEELGTTSRILTAEIERPRVGPMRDIVATIQPEQDVIVRAELTRSVCVQGAPGTGKTAVGLHRAAYLLYAYRDQLTKQGVLVVGPNASFLRYIGDVLPALGEVAAEQTTVEELTGRSLTSLGPRYAVRGTDAADVATLKGDARMAEVVRRAVWSHVREPAEGLLVPWGARRWRVSREDVAELLAELRSRGVRYGAARTMLAQRLAHAVLVRMEDGGEAPDDRVQDAVARSRPVRAYVDQVWPAVDPARLVHRLLSDPAFLASAAAGVLDEEEQRRVRWTRPARTPASTPWSVADSVLVDEALDCVQRTGSVGHVVADEAQDLSPMMLRAVGRRCTTGSMTVLGDLAQATTPWATRSWAVALDHLGKPGAHVEQLTRGFRVPGEVLGFATRLLPIIAPGLEPPVSVRRSRGELGLRQVGDVVAATVDELSDPRADRIGSTGVIVPDDLVDGVAAALASRGLGHTVLGRDGDAVAAMVVVAATLAKGLEFDHVVLVEPAAIVAGEPDRMTGLRRLYVCLTRAVTSLVVLHADELPPELGSGWRGRRQ